MSMYHRPMSPSMSIGITQLYTYLRELLTSDKQNIRMTLNEEIKAHGKSGKNGSMWTSTESWVDNPYMSNPTSPTPSNHSPSPSPSGKRRNSASTVDSQSGSPVKLDMFFVRENIAGKRCSSNFTTHRNPSPQRISMRRLSKDSTSSTIAEEYIEYEATDKVKLAGHRVRLDHSIDSQKVLTLTYYILLKQLHD